jgi:hypothetical protein
MKNIFPIKRTISIVLFILFIIALIVTVWYLLSLTQEKYRQLKQKPKQQEQLIKNQNVLDGNLPQKQDNQNLANINTSIESADYHGQIIKESDGWKRYANQVWRISFRFHDPEDRVKIMSEANDSIQFAPTGVEHIYLSLFRFNYTTQSLYDYVQRYWNDFQEQAKLINIEQFSNKNNISFLKTVVLVDNPYAGTTAKVQTYYTEYPRNYTPAKKRLGNQITILKISSIQFLENDVIDSFQFLIN